MRLYVAMLRGDNETEETRQLRGLGKAVEQMVRLRRAIVASDRFVRGHATNDKYHALFVAPEYYFANRRSPRTSRGCSSSPARSCGPRRSPGAWPTPRAPSASRRSRRGTGR